MQKLKLITDNWKGNTIWSNTGNKTTSVWIMPVKINMQQLMGKKQSRKLGIQLDNLAKGYITEKIFGTKNQFLILKFMTIILLVFLKFLSRFLKIILISIFYKCVSKILGVGLAISYRVWFFRKKNFNPANLWIPELRFGIAKSVLFLL